MQTLKTAVIVVLLLVVFYGVYEMLNRPPDEPPADVAQIDAMAFDPPEIQFGESTDAALVQPAASASPTGAASSFVPPAPPSTVPPPPSNYGLETTSSFPADNAPNDTSSPLSVEPPDFATPRGSAAPAPPPGGYRSATPPVPTSPALSDGRDTAAEGPIDPRLQRNPFVHENVMVRPGDVAARTTGEQIGVRAYERARKMARSFIEEGKYHDALSTLSIFYKSQDLTPEEQRELLDLLDPLAGRVIYSKEHLVEPAYAVRRNETLSEIAQRYNVPAHLLQKINGIENPDVLVPGTELKVVSGPFRAEVDLPAQELTVFLGRLYAGRFPITLGRDPEPIEGDFKIRDKRKDREYYGMDGRQIPAGNPANPFGNVWLDLGREICIHGSPDGGLAQQRGCISLSPQDADDVYSILSVGSAVRILR